MLLPRLGSALCEAAASSSVSGDAVSSAAPLSRLLSACSEAEALPQLPERVTPPTPPSLSSVMREGSSPRRKPASCPSYDDEWTLLLLPAPPPPVLLKLDVPHHGTGEVP